MWRRTWWLLVGVLLGVIAVSATAFAQTPWGFGGSAQLLPWGTSAGNTTELRFYELVAGGGQYVYWKAPDSIPTTWGCTWPAAPGTVNQTLRTDGGNPCTLTWATGAGSGSVTNTGALTANAFILGNGGTDVIAQAINGIVIGHGASAPTAYAGTTPCAAGDFVTALNLFGVATCATPAGSGNVTAGATLTADRLVIGAGTTAISVLGSAGTTTTLLHGGSPPTYSAVSLTADVTGTLPVGNGGTGATTLTIHGVLLGQTTGAVVATAAGATGTVLAGSTGADPAFTATPTVTSVTTTGQGAVVIGPFGGGATQTGELRFAELTGGNYRGFKAADALTGDLIWTLPTADGAGGECLTTDGSGTLSWGACSAGAGTGITSLGGLNAAIQTFGNDTNVTMVSATATHTLTWAGLLAVTRGGTGIASGTSGGIPYFSGTTTLASSGALTANRLVLGGGAGASPTVLGAGTATTVLHGNAGGAPTFSAVALADLGTTGTPTSSTYLRGDYAWISAPFAPTAAPYVVITNDATLTAERALAVSTGLSLSDGGANAAVTLSVNQGTAFNWTGIQTWTQGAQFGNPTMPTGGNKGAGTINVAGGYYVNGVLLSGTGTVTGSGAVGQDTYWTSASALAGEATIIHARAHGLLTAATAAENKTAMNAAIAACNAGPGCRLLLPGGQYSIDPGLTAFSKAAVVEGVGAFSSLSSGTTFNVSGAGTLFTVTSAPVLFQSFTVSGGTTAIAFSAMVGPGGASRLHLQGQTGVAITLSNSNTYTIRDCEIGGYTTAAFSISGSDNGDALIEGNTITGPSGANSASVVLWTGAGGLRFLSNKILTLGVSSGASIDLNVAEFVKTADMLFHGNSFEGSYAYAILVQRTGTNLPNTSMNNLIITGNQFTGQLTDPPGSGSVIAINSDVAQAVNITNNIITGGASPIHINITNAQDTYIGGNTFVGNGQSPDAINIGSSALRTTVGANHYGNGISRSIVSTSTTTLVTVPAPVSSSGLITAANGSVLRCTNCQSASIDGLAAPYTCASGGTGATATLNNGTWKCLN